MKRFCFISQYKYKCSFWFLLAMCLVINLGCNKQLQFNEGDGNLPFKIETTKNKLLLITIQGGRGDIMQNTEMPQIKSLLSSSIYSWDAFADETITDRATWLTLLTGVKSDEESNNNSLVSPTIFSYLKKSNEALIMHALNRDVLLDKILQERAFAEKVLLTTDEGIKNEALVSLAKDQLDGLFVNFSNVNDAGVQGGFSISNKDYVEELKQTDEYIGEIVNIVKKRENEKNEKWMVVITSNKGGGESLSEQRKSFVLYRFLNRKEMKVKKPFVNVDYAGDFPFFQRENGAFHLAYSNSPIYNFGAETNFTIEFKIKTTGTTTDYPIIANKDWDAGTNQGWLIYLWYDRIKINYAGGGTDIRIHDGPIVDDDKWHHITVVFNRKGPISIYNDGELYYEGSNLLNSGSVDTNLPLVIGGDGTKEYGSESLNSYLSDIRIWKAALNGEEVKEWAYASNLEEHPQYKRLVGYWKANSGVYNSLFLEDSSLEKEHLKIYNMLTFQSMSDILNPSDIDPVSQVPNSVDLAPNVLIWMGVKIKDDWGLKGKIWIAN